MSNEERKKKKKQRGKAKIKRIRLKELRKDAERRQKKYSCKEWEAMTVEERLFAIACDLGRIRKKCCEKKARSR